MTLRIEIVDEANDEVVDALNRLLPQLSSTATLLTLTQLRDLVESSSTTLFVARIEGTLVGALTLAVFRIPTGLRGWIEDVVVDESARGTGVGEALTLAAIEEAKRRGIRSLDLTTRPTRHAANRLYSRLGFERRETNVYRFVVDS
ncbi:MAG TPA: GNAT family N-acetyltransferase [Acidimicrobiales bacterium]